MKGKVKLLVVFILSGLCIFLLNILLITDNPTVTTEGEDPEATYLIANMYYSGIVVEGKKTNKNYEEAFKLFHKAAMKDHIPSQLKIATMYLRGKGVKKNEKQAFYWLEKAAVFNDAKAQFMLGLMYESGIGVSLNYEKALEMYEISAKNGHPPSQYYLSTIYHDGERVEKNIKQFTYWVKQSAEQGYPEARLQLAHLYRDGDEIEQDLDRAIKIYEGLVKEGNSDAANSLAYLLATCPTKKICDGERAVELSKQYLIKNEEPHIQDTVAASFARVGKFKEAIEYQKMALSLLPEEDESIRKSIYKKRIQKFMVGEVINSSLIMKK